jgi:hypothetical protein
MTGRTPETGPGACTAARPHALSPRCVGGPLPARMPVLPLHQAVYSLTADPPTPLHRAAYSPSARLEYPPQRGFRYPSARIRFLLK